MGPFAVFEACIALGLELRREGAMLGVRGPSPLPAALRDALFAHKSRLLEALDPLPLVELWHPTHQDAFEECVSSMVQDDLLSEQDAHTLAYLLVIERQESWPSIERLAGLSHAEASRLLEPITPKDSVHKQKNKVSQCVAA